ncbi:hypothetical protein RHMOL_Rhmol03G0272600 [Rhododendron molle]|uniref:Uncharacterized protein n=1 Tax=Rhododendron molle TaxID=49168 RepID=A0ACC0PM58_RHOML|nr:hypothetical protein RHMOL_Rhmol03G0272600 [Rhododendron molle]
MASAPSLFCCIFFIIFIAAMDSPVQASKEFKVGGSEGWRTPDENESAIYDQWSARKRFRVGDSLRETLNALKSCVLFEFEWQITRGM